ncbi:MAG: PEP-CTERM sorting domain-containing protein [Crocosphaera sp.]
MRKNSSLFLLKIVTGAGLLLTLAPLSAKAAIISYSYEEENITYNLSPDDAEFEAFINDDYNFWHNPRTPSKYILGFNEEQQVTLDQAIPYHRLNEWDDMDIPNLPYLSAGLVVDSHMLFFDNPDWRKGAIFNQATVQFSGKIVGLMGDSGLFYSNNGRYDPYFDSNYLFAPDPTRNPVINLWSLEEGASWTPLDEVQFLSEDTIRLTWSTRSSIDPLRVITLSPTVSNPSVETVPEPLTLLGAGSAIAMGGFFKSKLKNKGENA